MSISNNLLAKLAMQDIISVNNTRAIEPFFNILFDTKSITNFYAIDSSFILTYYYSKERENSIIKDNISQQIDDLVLRQK